MVKIGPTIKEGNTWDEGGKIEIVQIFISHEEDNIMSIQFVCVVDGSKVTWRTRSRFNKVRFDYPSEYLTSVRGDVDSFGTNKRDHGPFGPFGGDSGCDEGFKYEFNRHCFGGFHGTASPYGQVYSIGVYIKTIDSVGTSKE